MIINDVLKLIEQKGSKYSIYITAIGYCFYNRIFLRNFKFPLLLINKFDYAKTFDIYKVHKFKLYKYK